MSSDEGSSPGLAAQNSDNLSDIDNAIEENGDLGSDVDDLFGDDEIDGDDQLNESRPRRALDDSELDSGDDEGRGDRLGSQAGSDAEEAVQEDIKIQLINLPRTVVPEPSDNEMYLAKVPHFLSIQPTAYKLEKFQPPVTEHHSKLPATETFDAYNTAITTVRWRHSPSDHTELQSNARFLRWSDGSLTLQLATNSLKQYEVAGNPLAPPQKNPPKPTPLTASKAKRKPSAQPLKDSFTYLAAPFPSAWSVRLTNKFTASLSIQPAKGDSDADSKALMMAMKAKYEAEQARGGVKLSTVEIDVERVKAEALKQEREEERRLRKVERDQEKQIRTARGGGRGGGLTIDDLEGDGGRPRQSRGHNRRPQRDYLSDEEEEMYGPRGGPNDAYDMEDDFLNDDDEGSDEDAEGEEDIDAIIERNERQTKNPGNASPKRPRDDDDTGHQDSPTSRHKRRRVLVVSDDEDD